MLRTHCCSLQNGRTRVKFSLSEGFYFCFLCLRRILLESPPPLPHWHSAIALSGTTALCLPLDSVSAVLQPPTPPKLGVRMTSFCLPASPFSYEGIILFYPRCEPRSALFFVLPPNESIHHAYGWAFGSLHEVGVRLHVAKENFGIHPP